MRGAAEGCRGRALPEEQVFITGGGAKAGQGADEGGEQPVLHTNQLFATASFGNLIISFFFPCQLQEQEIRKLQVSLEQEQQEAKSREEELQVALEDKVPNKLPP